MKGRKHGFSLTVMAIAAVLIFTGCFKKVSKDTLFIIKPNLQTESGGGLTIAEGATAFAWFNRTAQWEIKSYDDAVAGRMTDTETGSTETVEPDAVSTVSEAEGRAGLLELDTRSVSVMLLVIYPEARMYAWRIFETAENLSPTYLTVQFRPWKNEGYIDSGWTVGIDAAIKAE